MGQPLIAKLPCDWGNGFAWREPDSLLSVYIKAACAILVGSGAVSGFRLHALNWIFGSVSALAISPLKPAYVFQFVGYGSK
jgi:hypothetical protein